MKEFKSKCLDCDTSFFVEVLDNNSDVYEVIACPFCGSDALEENEEED